MRLTHFLLRALLPLVALCAFSLSAAAQGFPNRPVVIVAPYPPGGASDMFARTVAEGLRDAWNQPVVVENRPGASGIIGADYVSRQPGDGHTLVVGAVSLHAVLPHLNQNMARAQENLSPISLIGINPSYVVVRTESGINTIGELIERLRKEPGKHNYGSAGSGTSQHIFPELLKQTLNLDVVHVPYKGSAQMVTGLLSGDVLFVIEQGPAVMGHVKNGRLKPLAVTTAKRSAALPDLPTVAETVSPGFEASTWFAIFGGPNVPAPIAKEISDKINLALKKPEVRDRLSSAGVEVQGSTPQELGARQQRDFKVWGDVIKKAGIKME